MTRIALHLELFHVWQMMQCLLLFRLALRSTHFSSMYCS